MALRSRILLVVVAIGVPTATYVLTDSALAVFVAALVTIVVALLAIPGFASLPPRLVVEFRNPKMGGRPVVTRNSAATSLEVWVCNRGRGAAESVEVTFEAIGAHVFNESGNNPDYNVLDVTVHPPRWHHPTRILARGDEIPIALLVWYSDSSRRERLRWTAKARGMEPQHGEVAIELVDGLTEGAT